jgi:RNA dependent RNA polymerase
VFRFEIDWEIWRFDQSIRLDLANCDHWQRTLGTTVDNPKKFWKALIARAIEVGKSDSRLPEASSTKAWELIKSKGWKEGSVHLNIKVTEIDPKGICKYTVKPMTVSSSRRAFRKWGADRFISISFAKHDTRLPLPRIQQFLRKPWEICGRTYELCYVKDGSKDAFGAYYFATRGAGLAGMELSIESLLNWFISPLLNCNSTAAKLWSRISLSFSSSQASIVFKPDEIRLVRDIESPTGECMTDGCARASPAVFREIWKAELWGAKSTPTAVQGRIGGAKGVWYVDPIMDLRSEERWIEIRESQLKYKYDSKTFHGDDVLRTLVKLFVLYSYNRMLVIWPDQIVASEAFSIIN